MRKLHECQYHAIGVDGMRIEDCISFLLGKAGQQVMRRSRDMLGEFGVTPVQYAALSVLAEEDGISGAELGLRLVLDSATITGVVDRLVTSSLVERRRSLSGDRRVQALCLTETGRRLMPCLDRVMAAVNAQVAAELMGDAENFWSSLRKLGKVTSA